MQAAGRVASVGRARRAAYPFFCMPSGPSLAPSEKLGCSRTARQLARRESENAERDKSVCCPVSRYRFTAAGAIWGNCSLVPIVTVDGSNAGGAKHGGAKSLLDLRCGMVMMAPRLYFAGMVQICR